MGQSMGLWVSSQREALSCKELEPRKFTVRAFKETCLQGFGEQSSSRRRAEAEIVIQRVALAVRLALEVLDQRLLHPEYCVLVDVRRALDEEMRRQRFVALGRKHEMQMRRPPGRSVRRSHQITHRPVGRNLIALRQHRAEMIAAVAV
jgi:hypothetical protein